MKSPRPPTRITAYLMVPLLVLAAAGLAACETTGLGTTTEAAKPAEPPMTHTRAAEQCWMAAEKAHAALPLDKRADIVDKCIEQKMKAASGNAEPAPGGPAPDAKKKKPASAAAAAAEKKKPAAPSASEKDQKPAGADAPDKKP
jgi:hypothetical protein